MRRREFIITLGSVAWTATVLDVGMPLRAFATGEAFRTLSPPEANTLIAVVHGIVPHRLPVLATAARGTALGIDAKLLNDPVQRAAVRAGLADLDARARKVGVSRFDSLTPTQQDTILRQIERSAFFQGLIAATLDDYYNRHDVWKAIGYPGASMNAHEKYLGGYLNKGFDTLEW